ncbi:uncharacterized protein [Choristoneura fumiferana]|uniref:uncharacterized protein n=1 Tax=Choristoneura fumiferana TaxID=7141 RepID=UPI003D158621
MGTPVPRVVYFLSFFYLIQCGYPPTGDEVQPGSVLLPASRRGRYLANIVRRQAVDGTGIKFNKDADRMNAEAKKKVDVLSEELLPYIIAEQERRTTLHKRVMTAIQNGEKGVTVAEIRNKPPLIIRKGLMYRCPANRAPKEPDGSGVLGCEDDITPTQIMYDSCLSAEDKELYNADTKYFFCNRHKIEGPDLPRNGSTVIGCAPIERTSLNYTTSKCTLEDTDDVVVHYRYYPDRTYKYVTELDPDHEVCDHWNPCQIGYIYSLPSPDMATPASELWQDSPEEHVHPSSKGPYNSSPRTVKLPGNSKARRSGEPLESTFVGVRMKDSVGGTRKLNENHFSFHLSVDMCSVTLTLTFSLFRPIYFGTYYAVIRSASTGRDIMIKFLTIVQSSVLVQPRALDCIHGQKLNSTVVPYKCNRCRLTTIMIRGQDQTIYNADTSRFRVTVGSRGKQQQSIEIDMENPKPQDFGDYFAIFQNGDGQEERVKILTVRCEFIFPFIYFT